MQALRLWPEFSLYQDPDHHFAISQLSAAMRLRNGLDALFLSSISRMRASAAARFCLRVAISAAAATARSAMIACISRGRADRALPPSGLVKISGDNAGVLSRHRLTGLDRLYQRAIRSEEIVPIVALGVVEQFAQCPHREGLRLVHARNVILHG
jgi:hypothetical protein